MSDPKFQKPFHKLLVILAGPTASGKTEASIRIASEFNCPVISADSRQFYREMSIGTAKPTSDEMGDVEHHFINSHSIVTDYNAGAFANEARTLIDQLFKKHDVVIVTGGSGMYIDALLFGIDDLPEADKMIRSELNKLYEEHGIEGLQTRLQKLDPEYYGVVDLDNPRRLMRALEVCMTTGSTYTQLRKNQHRESPWPYLLTGINLPREVLYDRINKRVIKMVEDGLIEEVTGLEEHRDKNAMQTVGYREVISYLDGKCSKEEMISLIQQNTRNYAKRQITWLRRYPDLIWLEKDIAASISKMITELMSPLS